MALSTLHLPLHYYYFDGLGFPFMLLHLHQHALYFLWIDFHPCLYIYIYRSFSLLIFCNKFLVSTLVYNGGISLGQKWWWTVLDIEISCSQWEGSACIQNALIFFLLSFGFGGGRIFSFSLCSQHVPFKFQMGSNQNPNRFHMFPMCSPRVFPIAPRLNPVCFAQSPPLLFSPV